MMLDYQKAEAETNIDDTNTIDIQLQLAQRLACGEISQGVYL